MEQEPHETSEIAERKTLRERVIRRPVDPQNVIPDRPQEKEERNETHETRFSEHPRILGIDEPVPCDTVPQDRVFQEILRQNGPPGQETGRC